MSGSVFLAAIRSIAEIKKSVVVATFATWNYMSLLRVELLWVRCWRRICCSGSVGFEYALCRNVIVKKGLLRVIIIWLVILLVIFLIFLLIVIINMISRVIHINLVNLLLAILIIVSIFLLTLIILLLFELVGVYKSFLVFFMRLKINIILLHRFEFFVVFFYIMHNPRINNCSYVVFRSLSLLIFGASECRSFSALAFTFASWPITITVICFRYRCRIRISQYSGVRYTPWVFNFRIYIIRLIRDERFF